MASVAGAVSAVSEPPAELAPMVVLHAACSHPVAPMVVLHSACSHPVAPMVVLHSACSHVADSADSHAVAPMVVLHSVCSHVADSADSRAVAPMVVLHSVYSHAAGSRCVLMAEPARAWEHHLKRLPPGSLLHLKLICLEDSPQALAAACSLVADWAAVAPLKPVSESLLVQRLAAQQAVASSSVTAEWVEPSYENLVESVVAVGTAPARTVAR
jgi:hypothetical protein